MECVSLHSAHEMPNALPSAARGASSPAGRSGRMVPISKQNRSQHGSRGKGEGKHAPPLPDEGWRHDTAYKLPEKRGRGGRGGIYFPKYTVNRPLVGIFKLFESQQLDVNIATATKPTIMELDCGEVRTVLELQARFPEAKVICVDLPGYGQAAGGPILSGLNRDARRESMLEVAQFYNISWKLDTHSSPVVVYADGTA